MLLNNAAYFDVLARRHQYHHLVPRRIDSLNLPPKCKILTSLRICRVLKILLWQIHWRNIDNTGHLISIGIAFFTVPRISCYIRLGIRNSLLRGCATKICNLSSINDCGSWIEVLDFAVSNLNLRNHWHCLKGKIKSSYHSKLFVLYF